MKRPKILLSVIVLALFPVVVLASSAGGFKRRDFQKQYRQILQEYSEGADEAAVEALVGVESAAVEAEGTEVLSVLRKAELGVVEDLSPKAGRALQPIIALHEKAYLQYREDRQSKLIPHAREMVVELIRRFANDADSAEGKTVASQMMTSLAGHLQEASVDSAAAGLYRRALNLDETNTTALMGLSFLHEQYGEYSDAVRHLESIVEIDPANTAARLRLGVILVRLGREESGAEYLRQVLTDGQERWMQSVAYQELARILTDSDELVEARELLEEGVKVVSDDPNLLIQLAYLSERNGSFGEDPALLLALRQPEASEPRLSPRFVYSQLPEEDLAVLRRELEKRADDSLGLLASALRP